MLISVTRTFIRVPANVSLTSAFATNGNRGFLRRSSFPPMFRCEVPKTASSVICVDQGWPCQLLFVFQSFIYFSNQAVARKRLLQKEHAFQEIAAAIVEF